MSDDKTAAERLRSEASAAMDWNGETMKRWDEIRSLCAKRDGSDLPRLMFEQLIEGLADRMIEGVARIEALEAQIAAAREALTDIDSWRYDTLGHRPRDESAETEVNAAFDRGARMAFYRCSDRARAALASLPVPEVAPTPIMQAAAKAAKTVDGWSDAKRRYVALAIGAPAAAPASMFDYDVDMEEAPLPRATPSAAPTREEIIEQCAAIVGNMRQSEAARFDDPKYASQRGCDRSDGLYDAYRAILALKSAAAK